MATDTIKLLCLPFPSPQKFCVCVGPFYFKEYQFHYTSNNFF